MNYRVCFAAYLRRQGRRESTIRSYAAALAEFVEFSARQGRRQGLLRQLVPARLESYKLYLRQQKALRPATVNRRLSALSALARFLVSRGMLSGNPLDLVSRVGRKPIKTEAMRLSWEGVQQLRGEVHQDVINVRDRAVVELLYAGLTVRELCALHYDPRWTADNGSIRLGERTVSLHARACLALEHYMILRPILRGEHLLVGKGPGWSMKPGSVYGMLRRWARLCGVRIGVRDVRLMRYAAAIYGFEPAAIPIAAAA